MPDDHSEPVSQADLERAHREGVSRWAGIDVEFTTFAAYLNARAKDQSVGKLHGADLYLACACASADPAALRAFDREYLQTLGAMLTKLDPPATIVDEVEQLLRDRLFVRTPEREPAITQYAGTGSLAGWLKVVAIREAMALMEKVNRQRGPGELDALMAPGLDPEFDHMRQRYRDEFREAFGVALSRLKDRDRDVLRCHLVERMSIDRIGQMYDVHRATAARWLSSIRDQLFEQTRGELTRRLDIGASEYESIMRLINSQLHVSLAAQLED